MKYLTFVVPCFNSQDYMERCINSLLVGGTDVEVIIIDDGSTDNTGKIANYYKNNFPEIVKVVHKRNAGHGSGINKGLEIAAGKYFKVVDSDDWIDRNAYLTLLRKIKYFCKIENKSDEVTMPDLFAIIYMIIKMKENIKRFITEMLFRWKKYAIGIKWGTWVYLSI